MGFSVDSVFSPRQLLNRLFRTSEDASHTFDADGPAVFQRKCFNAESRAYTPRTGPMLDCSHLMTTMITISKEDYLKAIAEAEAEGKDVIPATLAHWLSVTRPAVTFALKRLTKDGLVAIKSDGHVRLTTQGREIAERTMVRHHLIERMLSEIFGMPWYEVHDEAERLEHAVSPAFEKKLIEKLGRKETCPHGNGLALRSPDERRKKGLCLLSDAAAGARYEVASVYERDRKLLEFFDKEGIRPGIRVAVEARNYDGTVSLAVGKSQIRLGQAAAEKVWVKKL